MASVTVQIPATTGNMGAGFDCIGMALSLYNTIQITETASGVTVSVEGEGQDLVPLTEENYCVKAAIRVCEATGRNPDGLHFRLHHEIPVSRGLGSSGVAIVAGAYGMNELLGCPLDTPTIIRICTDMEGHPDNVVPSLLGGLSISGERYGTIIYRTVSVSSDLSAIVAVPDFTLETKLAREALPETVSMQDAVFNMCSVGLMIHGMMTKDYDLLRAGTDDRLHQPYRESLVPGLREVMEAARSQGAHSAALSGAGPTVIALASKNQAQVATAMSSTFDEHGISCRTLTLEIDNHGARRLD